MAAASRRLRSRRKGATQEHSGFQPVTLNSARRDAERDRGFILTETAEEPALHNLRQTWLGLRQAIDRMVQNATMMGANAIISFRFDSSELANTMSEIVAYGTAVVVAQDSSAPQPGE